MTAILAASQSILKTRYPDGRLPKAQYVKFPFAATITKKEDFDGNNKVIALQTENPQGSSADFGTALGSLAQGAYKNFLLTRVQHFGIARITGQALKAAQKSTGSLVDLWRNETDGISATEMKCLEIYLFGSGDAVLGTISSGQTSATITLTNKEDIVKCDLGMRLQAVSATGLSPTLRSGYVTIGSIDRSNGTITTVSGNWSDAGNIPGITSTDSLVRAGDAASAGVATVITGAGQWLVGGTSPGTVFGLNRNVDPVRLASQDIDVTGLTYEDALIDVESYKNLQYVGGELVAWVHPRDLAQMKKQMGGKATYPRTEMKSSKGEFSFSAVEFNGDYGPIKLMTSPFIQRHTGFLLDMDTLALESLGPAPHMLDYDGPNFLRVASDDAYEVRFGMYGNMSCNLPVANAKFHNFGL